MSTCCQSWEDEVEELEADIERLLDVLESVVEDFSSPCGKGVYDDRAKVSLVATFSSLVLGGRATRVSYRRICLTAAKEACANDVD